MQGYIEAIDKQEREKNYLDLIIARSSQYTEEGFETVLDLFNPNPG